MNRIYLFLLFTCLVLSPVITYGEGEISKKAFTEEEMRYLEEPEPLSINDPIEPINRVFFVFNDRLYFWALRPLSKGYALVFPEPLRVCFSRAIENVKMPVRAINCLLQVNVAGFFKEILRFAINSTIGILGFADPAKDLFGLEMQDKDFGQTLGQYGIGHGFYVVLPVLGPSTLRDTVGKAGDNILNPFSYLETREIIYTKTFEVTNEASLKGIDYEKLKESSLDPYLSLRDAYFQQREAKQKH